MCTATPLAARVNLTIPASRLPDLARQTGPPGPGGWSFTRELTVDLEPMPTFGCDHRHESRA